MFVSRAAFPSHVRQGKRCTACNVSPPKATTRTRRRLAAISFVAARRWNAEGVWLRTDTPGPRSKPANSLGDCTCVLDTITALPPVKRAPNSSQTEKSKANECVTDQTSCTSKSNDHLDVEIRLHTPRCATITPLGRPVEPEV